MIKEGDQVCFFIQRSEMLLACEVKTVSEDEISLWVINGAYPLRIRKMIPCHSSDYNVVCENFRKQMKNEDDLTPEERKEKLLKAEIQKTEQALKDLKRKLSSYDEPEDIPF